MRNWRSRSTRPTNGSSSGPASAAATSPPTARPPPRLAVEACRKALEAAGLEPSDIGLIVLATATPDQTFPSSATKVQALLGIDDCIAFDVHAVCTGFLYALTRRRLDASRRQCQARAGDRIGNLQPDPRLGGSHHLRPVRRRRRRGRAGGRGRRVAASSRPGFMPTAATTACCSSTAARRPPARSASSG